MTEPLIDFRFPPLRLFEVARLVSLLFQSRWIRVSGIKGEVLGHFLIKPQATKNRKVSMKNIYSNSFFALAFTLGAAIQLTGCAAEEASDEATSTSDDFVAGLLDEDFGTGGVKTLDLSGLTNDDYGRSLVVDSTGKILVAGTSASNNFVTRFDATGAVDTTFGTSGTLAIDFHASFYDSVTKILPHSGGSLFYVVGHSTDYSTYSAAVARFDSTGALDTTFNTTGKATYSLASTTGSDYKTVADATIDSNNQITWAGQYLNGSYYNWYAAQVAADGSMVSGFGTTGVMTLAENYYSYGQAVAVDSAGQVYLGGTKYLSSAYSTALGVFSTAGAAVSAFGSSGYGILLDADHPYTSFNEYYATAISKILPQSDGSVFMIGSVDNDQSTNYDPFVVKFSSTGTLVTTFGSAGRAVMALDGDQYITDAKVDADGNLVLIGYSDLGTHYAGFVARLDDVGALDTGFGTDESGVTTIDTTSGQNVRLHSGAFNADGDLIVTGFADMGTTEEDFDILLAKLKMVE